MKSAKLFFLFMFVIMTITGVLLLKKISLPTPTLTTSSFFNQLMSTIKDAFTVSFDYSIDYSSSNENASSSAEPSIPPTTTPKTTIKPSSSPTTKTQPASSAQSKTCYRYTVPHLDGSSSTKCYSQTDYQSLQNLGARYNSAKSDYNFEISVAEMYAKSSSDFASEFFKKPAEDARARAQAAQNLMGEIALQMYAIEARGW